MIGWHNTADASRIPEFVSSGQEVELWIGTHPIEMGQSVWVELTLSRADGKQLTAKQPAEWHSNNDQRNNSYWRVLLGTFGQGDRLEYRICGSRGEEQIMCTETFEFEVS